MVRRGAYSDPVSDLLERFCRFQRERGKKTATLSNYRYDLGSFLNEVPAPGLSPEAICCAAVEHAFHYREKLIKLISPATANRKMSSLNSFFGWAAHCGWIPETRIPSLPQVFAAKRSRKPARVLSESEQSRLLKRAKDHGEVVGYALLSLMLDTGSRISEIQSARWKDVHLEENSGFITIHNAKSGRPISFPLGDPSLDALRALKLTNRSTDDSPLFSGKKSGPLTRQQIAYILEHYFAACGLQDARPSMLRATYEANLIASGIDLYDLANLMGYSRLHVPQERYAQYRTRLVRNRLRIRRIQKNEEP